MQEKTTVVNRKEIILVLLYQFKKQGEKETSISEFQEAVLEFQKSYDLGYRYTTAFPYYSFDLSDEIEELLEAGYIRKFDYIHDAFLPKIFLCLSPPGQDYAEKVFGNFDEQKMKKMMEVVTLAINNYRQRWRLSGRR